MAEVYLGSHLTLERPVAVKVLHSYIEEEPVLLERFGREAKVVAGLRHPNIIRIFDFDAANNHPYIVMEYLKGPTLETYLRHLHQRKKRVPFDQIARLLQGLTAALDYAHGQGVIHRDVKPSNILLHSKADEISPGRPLPDDVEAILTDFGLVRFVDAATATVSGFISATPTYASPEQARGTPMDHRTDLYSLGVVLYEMLAGHVPFEADNAVAMLHMHIHTAPPPIPGIPAKVQQVVDRALQKKPDDRFQTGREMASTFDRSIDVAAPPEPDHEVPQARPIRVHGSPGSSPSKPAMPASTKPEAQPARKQEPPAVRAATPAPRLSAVPPPVEKLEPKPARPWKWIGVGMLALAGISLVALGALRLLSSGALSSKATQAAVPMASSAGTSPSASTASNVPSTTNMVKVDAGSYEVGTSLFEDQFHVAPQEIQLNSFWIDQYQTTNAEYQQYMAATGSPKPMVWPGEAKHPVRGVTWDQAAAYCKWADKRLPDEAEWEAAGRGPGQNPQLYPWGTDATAGGAALTLPSQDTYEEGSQPFNISPFKVYDLVGNVWEWVGEPYASIQNGFRVLRGGRYGNPQDLAYRLVAPPDGSIVPFAGFRCAVQLAGEN